MWVPLPPLPPPTQNDHILHLYCDFTLLTRVSKGARLRLELMAFLREPFGAVVRDVRDGIGGVI